MNRGEYPFITLPYNKCGSMTDFSCAINRIISTRKNGAFHFDHSVEQGKIYISSFLDNDKVILNDNLGNVPGLYKITTKDLHLVGKIN